MSKEELQTEKMYQISIAIAKSMLSQGVISEESYCLLQDKLLKKYRPILGTLLSGNPLTF